MAESESRFRILLHEKMLENLGHPDAEMETSLSLPLSLSLSLNCTHI